MSAEQVLAEIAQAGYIGAPISPRPGETARELVERYAVHGLRPAPGYLGASFWRADRHDQILEQARQLARLSAEAGCTELYVAADSGYVTSSGKTRLQVSGHVSSADGLTDEENKRFADTLNLVGELTLREGVRSCFHNHVGTPIETREEIDRLFALADPNVVFLGPDTGHLAWAGADVLQFFSDYASRIKTAHLKDIDPDVARRGREEDWDYGVASRNGIWIELGQGAIDFPAVLDTLRAVNFQGWLIVETDVARAPTALESAIISREYLKKIGL